MTSINPNTTHGQIATIIVDNLVDGEEGVKDQQEEEDLQRGEEWDGHDRCIIQFNF